MLAIVASLLLRRWRDVALVAAVVAGTVLWSQLRQSLIEKGVAIEHARVLDSTLAVLRPQLARRDTVLVRDTVEVTRTITRVQTLRDTVLAHLTDTLVVREYVTRTDSALHACSEMAHDCAAFRATANQTIAALDAKLAAMVARPAKSCVRPSLLTGALGLGVGLLVPHLHR